jgi:hypothetical protein
MAVAHCSRLAADGELNRATETTSVIGAIFAAHHEPPWLAVQYDNIDCFNNREEQLTKVMVEATCREALYPPRIREEEFSETQRA